MDMTRTMTLRDVSELSEGAEMLRVSDRSQSFHFEGLTLISAAYFQSLELRAMDGAELEQAQRKDSFFDRAARMDMNTL